MATLHNIHCALQGEWVGGPWIGETAQFGLRLAIAPVIGAPDLGAIFTPVENGDVVMDQGSSAATHGTLARAWKARIGPSAWGIDLVHEVQLSIGEAFWTWADATKTMTSASFAWKRVRITPVAPDGKIPEHASTFTFTTGVAGSGTSTLPPQLAMAVSLRSPVVGRRGRGRIFVGGLAYSNTLTLGNDGTIPAAGQTLQRNSLKNLVDALQAVLTPPAISIVSVMSADSATAIRPSEIRTGNRLDTIQSRRRQVAEVYASTPL